MLRFYNGNTALSARITNKTGFYVGVGLHNNIFTTCFICLHGMPYALVGTVRNHTLNQFQLLLRSFGLLVRT